MDPRDAHCPRDPPAAPPPHPCEDSEAPSAGHRTVGKTMEPQPDVLPAQELPEVTTTMEKSSIVATPLSLKQLRCEDTEQAVSHHTIEVSPPVSALRPTRLLTKYFIRVDIGGFFHTYPHRGGPFKSLQEAQDAIDSHHAKQIKFKYMGELSKEDIHVWQTLYWPNNGTRMNSQQALDAMMNHRPKWELINALLDKYNEDHHLLGHLAYEVKEIVAYKPHFQRKDSAYGCRSFSHLNLTVKRGPDGINHLFFAEITCMKDGELEEYVLSCICAVTPDDDGECCECGDDVKHPTNVEYKKGQAKSIRRKGCRRMSEEEFNEFIVLRDEDWLDAEEARVRRDFRMSKIEDGHGIRGKYIIPAKR